MIACALVAVTSAALAQNRLVCTLFGDDYPRERYPDGVTDTWWIDGDRLKQAPKGSRKDAVPGLAWMRILKHDDETLVAEWPTMIEGASHRFTVDLKTGEAEDRTFFENKFTENFGKCRLVVEAEA